MTSWTSANLATRRSGRRDISRWVATASKWLRRNPSIPAAAGPTATRTAGWAAVAAARAPAPLSAAAASQAHTDEELAITVSDLPGTGRRAEGLGGCGERGLVRAARVGPQTAAVCRRRRS